MIEIIRNLLNIRDKKFKTDEAFALALGVKRQSVSNWRAYLRSGGKEGSRVAQVTIDKACKTFGVTETQLRKSNNQENGTRVKQLELINPSFIEVPFISQYAYAGYLSGYSDENYMETLPTIPFMVDKEVKGNYVCFEVRGDSMDDGTANSYRSGDRLICREISPNLWNSRLHIKQWDFVIVHKTDGILLKDQAGKYLFIDKIISFQVVTCLLLDVFQSGMQGLGNNPPCGFIQLLGDLNLCAIRPQARVILVNTF